MDLESKTLKELIDYINILTTKSILTLSDIKYILDNNLVSELLLNKKVCLPNYHSNTDIWRIIGINHDKTHNTIDLISDISAIEPMVFDNESNIYENSSIRKYLNNDFYNGFDNNIKNMMKEMEVSSNNKILKDKVKILSMTELGLEDYNNEDICKNEGNPYPVSIHMLKDKDDKYITHMTRSHYLGYSRCVWQINSNGGVDINYYLCERGAAPVIRLGL